MQDINRIVPMYDGAEKKPYYKYLLMPIEQPPQGAEFFKNLVKKESGLEFADRQKMQTEGLDTISDGVYIQNDGGILIAANVPAPDLTPETLNWWFAWHFLDPLRYAIWDPNDHFDTIISEKERQRLLDQTIPYRERPWGMNNSVKESMNGEEPMDLNIYFKRPSDIGFSDQVNDSTCTAFFCGSAMQDFGTFKAPLTIALVLVRDEKNASYVIKERFWLGYGINDEGIGYTQFPTEWLEPFAEKFQSLALHCHKEYRHLNKILPSVYKENKDNW
ncbi:hypothetical protein FW755_00615 [Lonepinella koalarum]|uniref:DAPG hydrolase PhiG domain-containing protein n=1 Tax=Lonepinella koalarum TaxID=53417 RepID=A0A4V2PUG3_9PAST|nr:hypothetical protein [Lonepinella koalarum]MDH2926920.1 hypothetical protein [Lonepinella koalarum]TCK70421.1 hypothetical protein EV692_0693 [Lonepinella koalarum]TFJ90190.1 hypothetical protein E0709_06020 [Lonepinella koalarum]TYG33699.1 hypothetical protein FW755_00615 [Lonepinella koalarum]